jgi:hypothetical protein
MYLRKIYDLSACAHRVRYAIANIFRDRIVNEGAFNSCFEMGDGDEVIRAILRRGLKNSRLRAALYRSHLVNLTHWLAPYPELAEAYNATDTGIVDGSDTRTQSERGSRQTKHTHRLERR